MRYKCKRSFYSFQRDENWEHIADEIEVSKGTVWDVEGFGVYRVEDRKCYRLVNQVGQTIDVYPEDLKRYFKVLED